MNIRDRLCLVIREILESKGIDYSENRRAQENVFVYVYKSAFYNEDRHRLKCMAFVRDNALVVRHFDESRYVCDEERFAGLCITLQNNLGYMSFDSKTKFMYYETSTFFDEFSFPSIRVFELLNEKASEYLFNRPLSLTDCTLPRAAEWDPPQEYFPAENLRAAANKRMFEMLSRSQKNAAHSQVKKIRVVSSNREIEGVNVFTFTMLARDMTRFPFFDGICASVSLPFLLFYNRTPCIPYLEGRKFCVKVQTVTEGIRFKATEHPTYIWLDMKNRQLKYEN